MAWQLSFKVAAEVYRDYSDIRKMESSNGTVRLPRTLTGVSDLSGKSRRELPVLLGSSS